MTIHSNPSSPSRGIRGGLFLLAIAATPVLADTVVTDADLEGAYYPKTYTGRITCHAPSIFMDTINFSKTNPQYYIYGSHLGRGMTSATARYQSWSTFGAGEESSGTSNSLFANTSGQRVNYKDAYTTHAVTTIKNCNGEEVPFGNFDAHGWQYSGSTVQGNQWAPDVIYNPTMGKWLMYMSLNGDHWCSSIVCFASDNPEGPWVYQGPVVFSGFQGNYAHVSYAASADYKHTDLELALGSLSSLPSRYNTGGSWGTYWPNCIDPCVFYDQEGKLWMSYGSWSGGIFLLELDETNGLRDYTVKYPYQVNGSTTTPGAANANCTCDPYFGYKIGGGYYDSGEASYIEYFNGYYYLWITNGGLTSDGGYQMRVYRSQSPEGPYLDPWGLDARPGKALKNYGSDAGRDYGVKIFGNYQWDPMPTAELAQGHNSAIVSHDGHLLLVNHTRFNDGTEGHSVRVHEMFQSQDGWIMASPFEYSGETVTQQQIASEELYSTSDIVGDYQLMIHEFRQNTASKAYATGVNVHLNADGTITGAYDGTWSVTPGTAYITVSLQKVLGKSGINATFHGVLTRQTIDYTDIPALCFTVCGTQKSECTQVANGSSLTTSGLCVWGVKADAKAAIKYTLDKVSLPSTVSKNITMPTGKLGAALQWATSDASVITAEGKVAGKGNAVLTATISKDGYVYTRDYAVTVDADATPVYLPVCGSEDNSATWWTAFSDTYTITRGKSAQFKFYNYNSGNGSNWNNWLLVCTNGKDSHGGGGTEYFVLRNDAYGWGNSSYSGSNITSDFNWSTFVADMNGSLNDMTITYEGSTVTMTDVITTKAGKVYNYSYTQSGVSSAQVGIFFTVELAHISSTGPNGESLGISEVMEDESVSPADQGIYDLYGRRHDTFQPGLNIIGGRKVIIR